MGMFKRVEAFSENPVGKLLFYFIYLFIFLYLVLHFQLVIGNMVSIFYFILFYFILFLLVVFNLLMSL